MRADGGVLARYDVPARELRFRTCIERLSARTREFDEPLEDREWEGAFDACLREP